MSQINTGLGGLIICLYLNNAGYFGGNVLPLFLSVDFHSFHNQQHWN